MPELPKKIKTGSSIIVINPISALCTQILRLYEGDDAIEMIDYLENVVSNVYAFDYCRNSATVINYCKAQKDFARKEG